MPPGVTLAQLQKRRAALLQRQKVRLDSAHRFGISQLAALKRQRATLERTERRAGERAQQMAVDVREAAARIDRALSGDAASSANLTAEQGKMGGIIHKLLPQWRETLGRWDEGQARRLQAEREEIDQQRKARHKAFREQQKRAALLALRKHELDVTKSRALQEDRARAERKDAFAREVVDLDKAIHEAARKKLSAMRHGPSLGSDLSDASRSSSRASSRGGSRGGSRGSSRTPGSSSGRATNSDGGRSSHNPSPVRSRVNTTAAAIQEKLARMERLRAEAESSGGEVDLSPEKTGVPEIKRRSRTASPQPQPRAQLAADAEQHQFVRDTPFTPPHASGAAAAAVDGGSSGGEHAAHSPAFDFQRPSPNTSLSGSQSEAERAEAGDVDESELEESRTPSRGGVDDSPVGTLERPAALTQWKEELRRQKEGTEALFAQMNEEDPAIGVPGESADADADADAAPFAAEDEAEPQSEAEAAIEEKVARMELLRAEVAARAAAVPDAQGQGEVAGGGGGAEGAIAYAVERRMGADGYAYTYEQFVEHYGREDEWYAAHGELPDADDSLHHGDWSEEEGAEEHVGEEEQQQQQQHGEAAQYGGLDEQQLYGDYPYEQQQYAAHEQQQQQSYGEHEQQHYLEEEAAATTPVVRVPHPHSRVAALQQRGGGWAPLTPPTPAGGDWTGVAQTAAASPAAQPSSFETMVGAAASTPLAAPTRPAAAVTPPSELSESNTSMSASFGDLDLGAGLDSPQAEPAQEVRLEGKAASSPVPLAVPSPVPSPVPSLVASPVTASPDASPAPLPAASTNRLSASRLQNQRQRRMSKGMSVRQSVLHIRQRVAALRVATCPRPACSRTPPLSFSFSFSVSLVTQIATGMIPLNESDSDDTEASPLARQGSGAATDSFDFGLSGSMVGGVMSPGGGDGSASASDSFPDLG